MKIVTDQRGLYSIRKGFWPFYKYMDFRTKGFWRSKSSSNYIDCWSQRDEVSAWYCIYNPKIAVIICTSNDKLN
jgi:hypothetical protein